MLKKIFIFLFSYSFKQKKMFLKDNFFTDKDENFTRLIQLIKKTVSDFENKTILDIGAFDGKTSLFFTKNFPNNNIIAFEPNTDSFLIAKKNCESNTKISILNIALSESSGEMDFNITENSVSSSLNIVSNTSAKKEGYSDQLSIKKTISVATKPLDEIEINEEVLFMKIDTQGHELQVLEGAKKTLHNTYFVLVEMSNHDIYVNGCKYYQVDNWLRENNFKLADIIITSKKNGILITEYDAIYLNKNKLDL